jgi:hypothetical protein
MPSPTSNPSKPWILILKLILLPFYLFLWGWMVVVLLLMLGKIDKELAEYVLGDIVRVLELVIAPGVLCVLIGRFYLRR